MPEYLVPAGLVGCIIEFIVSETATSKTPLSVLDLIRSDDPLSTASFRFLLDYYEEDPLVDFKETFDPKEEKEWLEITKDVMGYANTGGGYLVFGIQDGTYAKKGLSSPVVEILKNTDLLMQKMNRFIEPPITHLRSKSYNDGKFEFIGVFIPASRTKTHVISKDGTFRFPSGEQSVVLRKGRYIFGAAPATSLLIRETSTR